MSNPVLEKLINRKERLEARVKLMKYRAMNKERKDDTRRKILAGAYFCQEMLIKLYSSCRLNQSLLLFLLLNLIRKLHHAINDC